QPHTFYPGHPYDLRPHTVEVAEGSLLARAVGLPALAVNSMHHQACREVAPGLVVTARSPDGLVEALEVAGHPFALAVQWHPEALPDAPEMRRLFEAFVGACARLQDATL
ncbi:MAG: C26 family cysteine hydrolase domain-containing family, partial [Chloroflexales bacterium]|nr:C26 family cysteine hydrolase domain-containing family [Chloroflexales bacterium]